MILLLSGGIDSIATWRLLGLPPAVNFDIGTIPMPKEQRALRWASEWFGCKPIKRTLPMEHELNNGWLPFRNSIMVLAAAQIDRTVALAAVAEWAPDKNVRWARRLEKAAGQVGEATGSDDRLRIVMPFAELSKGELLMAYHKRFGSYEAALLLRNTWSCYLAEDAPCLSCGGCRQRTAAHHQYAALSGEMPPPETAARWRIPPKDRYRWIRDNGLLGLRQIAAHNKQDYALPSR